MKKNPKLLILMAICRNVTRTVATGMSGLFTAGFARLNFSGTGVGACPCPTGLPEACTIIEGEVTFELSKNANDECTLTLTDSLTIGPDDVFGYIDLTITDSAGTSFNTQITTATGTIDVVDGDGGLDFTAVPLKIDGLVVTNGCPEPGRPFELEITQEDLEGCVEFTPSLFIAKSADVVEYANDGTINYTLAVTNDGTVDSTNTMLDDFLPTGFTISDGTTFPIALGTIAPGQTVNTTFAVVPYGFAEPFEDQINSATVSNDEGVNEKAAIILPAAPCTGCGTNFHADNTTGPDGSTPGTGGGWSVNGDTQGGARKWPNSTIAQTIKSIDYCGNTCVVEIPLAASKNVVTWGNEFVAALQGINLPVQFGTSAYPTTGELLARYFYLTAQCGCSGLSITIESENGEESILTFVGTEFKTCTEPEFDLAAWECPEATKKAAIHLFTEGDADETPLACPLSFPQTIGGTAYADQTALDAYVVTLHPDAVFNATTCEYEWELNAGDPEPDNIATEPVPCCGFIIEDHLNGNAEISQEETVVLDCEGEYYFRPKDCGGTTSAITEVSIANGETIFNATINANGVAVLQLTGQNVPENTYILSVKQDGCEDVSLKISVKCATENKLTFSLNGNPVDLETADISSLVFDLTQFGGTTGMTFASLAELQAFLAASPCAYIYSEGEFITTSTDEGCATVDLPVTQENSGEGCYVLGETFLTGAGATWADFLNFFVGTDLYFFNTGDSGLGTLVGVVPADLNSFATLVGGTVSNGNVYTNSPPAESVIFAGNGANPTNVPWEATTNCPPTNKK